jgi:hypothetical protein
LQLLPHRKLGKACKIYALSPLLNFVSLSISLSLVFFPKFEEYQYLMNLIKEKVDADITSLEDICKTFKDWGKEIWN